MANTTADKLAKLNSTKAALKTSINGSGNLVGDVFADYPGAVDDFRAKVATAITAKGVATAATDTPDQMAANIGEIESGSSIELCTGRLSASSKGSVISICFFDGKTSKSIEVSAPNSDEIQVAVGSYIYIDDSGFVSGGLNLIKEYGTNEYQKVTYLVTGDFNITYS